VIWFFQGSERIPRELQLELTDPRHELFLSDVSLLEIVIKYQMGKLPLPSPPSRIILPLAKKHLMDILPLSSAAILRMERLPLHHRDPFDRLLVAQAITHRATLVSPDPLLRRYEVALRWKD
jgi:PIN domain nuclease of toxin-antitoxin system